MIGLLEERCVTDSAHVFTEAAGWHYPPAPLAVNRQTEAPTDCSDLEQDTDATVYKVAATRGQLHAAMRLVHDNYVRQGLIKPNKYGMRVIPQHAFPTTEVLVAARMEEVIATMSIVGDSRHGLPLESLYPDEVEAFRERGFCVAEVGCLADRYDEAEGKAGSLFRLMALVAQRSKRNGIDVLLVVCHPRHAKFYERFLGFEQFGEEKPYEKVSGNPAVALSLDLHGLREHNPRAYRRLFGEPFPEETLRRRSVPQYVLDELQSIAEAIGGNHSRSLASELACA